MPIPSENVLNTTRMFLNDNGSSNPQLWTDNVLFPMLNRAYQELQVTLRQRAAPIMKLNFTQILDPGTLVLPIISDLVSPIQIYESYPAGPASLMTEADPLPQQEQGPVLNFWQWDGININFVGSTAYREILIFYWRSLPLVANPTDNILPIDADIWLAPRTAAIAAASVGEETTSAAAAASAASFYEQVILANRGRAPQLAGASVKP